MEKSIFKNMKAAIFDMDGTILDSMGMWHTASDRYLATKNRNPKNGLWDIVKRLNMVETAEYLKENYDLEEEIETICEEIHQIIIDEFRYKLQLKPGAREFLEFLNEKKIPCILATATERACVIECMKRLDAEKYFKEIYTCLDFNTSKSQPLIFLKSAEAAGAKPEETVVFEDALHCIRTAHDANFRVCAVYDESDEERTEPPETDWERILKICDMSCRSFEEILPLAKAAEL